jgi:hypothetical protein
MDASTTATAAIISEEHQASYRRVFRMLQEAYTRAEIVAAENAYEEHLRRWPRDAALDMLHGWHYTVQHAEEREREAERLGLTPQEAAERENMLKAAALLQDAYASVEHLQSLLRSQERLKAWLQHVGPDSSAERALALVENELEVVQFFRSADTADTPAVVG